MSKYTYFIEPHGSPYGKPHEPAFKQCPECSGAGLVDSETCWCCDGTGEVEMTADEEEMERESKMEEYYED